MIKRADQRAGDATDAAGKAGAADDDSGDRVQFVGNAGLRQGGAGAGRQHHAGKARQRAPKWCRRRKRMRVTLMPDVFAACGLPPTA
jgi:hypothetical protein